MDYPTACLTDAHGEKHYLSFDGTSWDRANLPDDIHAIAIGVGFGESFVSKLKFSHFPSLTNLEKPQNKNAYWMSAAKKISSDMLLFDILIDNPFCEVCTKYGYEWRHTSLPTFNVVRIALNDNSSACVEVSVLFISRVIRLNPLKTAFDETPYFPVDGEPRLILRLDDKFSVNSSAMLANDGYYQDEFVTDDLSNSAMAAILKKAKVRRKHMFAIGFLIKGSREDPDIYFIFGANPKKECTYRFKSVNGEFEIDVQNMEKHDLTSIDQFPLQMNLNKEDGYTWDLSLRGRISEFDNVANPVVKTLNSTVDSADTSFESAAHISGHVRPNFLPQFRTYKEWFDKFQGELNSAVQRTRNREIPLRQSSKVISISVQRIDNQIISMVLQKAASEEVSIQGNAIGCKLTFFPEVSIWDLLLEVNNLKIDKEAVTFLDQINFSWPVELSNGSFKLTALIKAVKDEVKCDSLMVYLSSIPFQVDHETNASIYPDNQFDPGTAFKTEERISQAWIPLPKKDEEVEKAVGRQFRVNITESYGRFSFPKLDVYVHDDLDEDKGSKAPSFIHISWHPFWIARVELPALTRQRDGGNLVAQYTSKGCEQGSWTFMNQPEVSYRLPPQAVGEAMEKGPRDNTDLGDAQLVPYRFSIPTRLDLFPSEKNKRYTEASLRSLDRLRDARLKAMETEFFYPLRTRFAVDENRLPEIRVSEVGYRLGALPSMLSSNPYLRLNELDSTVRQVVSDEVVSEQMKHSYNLASVARWNYAARLGMVALHRDDMPGRFRLDEQLNIDIRRNIPVADDVAAASANPIRSDQFPSKEDERSKLNAYGYNDWVAPGTRQLLKGGALFLFDFGSELLNVLANPKTKQGSLENIVFSALGAWGEQTATFNNGKTKLSAGFAQGQLSWCKKETIGRISAIYNRAKHVVIYRRMVAPSRQFAAKQPNHYGRPILRKAEEYIEIIERERPFAQEAAVASFSEQAQKMVGSIHSFRFKKDRIPVDSDWGSDYDHGYSIPLWRADADPGIYPKPEINPVLYDADGGTQEDLVKNPWDLHFYSNQQSDTSANPDDWPAVFRLDVSRARAPTRETAPPDSLLGKAPLPDPMIAPPGHESLTIELAGIAKINLAHGRSNTAINTTLEALTLSRAPSLPSLPTPPPSVVPPEQRIQELVDWLEHAAHAMQSASLFSLNKATAHQCAKECGDAKARLKASYESVKGQVDNIIDNLPNLGEVAANPGWVNSVAEGVENATAPLRQALAKSRKDFNEGAERIQKAIRAGEAQIRTQIDGFFTVFALQFDTMQSPFKRAVLQQVQAIENDVQSAALVLTNLKAKLDELQSTINQPATIEPILVELTKQLDQLEQKLSTNNTSALGTLRTTAKLIIEDGRQLIDAIRGVKADWDKQSDHIIARIKELSESLTRLKNWLSGLKIDPAIINPIKAFGDQLAEFHQQLILIVAPGTVDLGHWFSTAAEEINKKFDSIDKQLDVVGQDDIQKLRDAFRNMTSKIPALDREEQRRRTNESLAQFYDFLLAILDGVCTNFDLTKFDDILQPIREGMNALSKDVVKMRQQLGELRQQGQDYCSRLAQDSGLVEESVGTALKLVRCLGKPPEMPDLALNRDRIAYYLFDFEGEKSRLLDSINMSGAAVQLREADHYLQSLGMRFPTESLQDRFLPTLQNWTPDLRALVPRIAGIDLRNLLNGAQLPANWRDKVVLKHQFDKQTGRLSAEAALNLNLPSESTVFESNGLAVVLRPNAHLRGSQKLAWQAGTLSTDSYGTLTSSWELRAGGQMLVAFRDLIIHYDDSGRLDVDLKPNNVELNPALSFISELAQTLGDEAQAARQALENGGITMGVAFAIESTTINAGIPGFSVNNLQFGAGFQLGALASDKGVEAKLKLSAHVGRKESPLIVTIGQLSGTAYLEATVEYDLMTGEQNSHMALSLGAGIVRQANLGGVAQGHLALTAYGEIGYESAVGGSLAIGALASGGARIISFVNANIAIGMEAKQASGGSLEGTGLLRVSVKISIFYTFRFKSNVKHRL